MFSGFRKIIDENSKEPVSIYLEYLDRSRFNAPAFTEELHRYLAAKYRDRPIGVIVAFGTQSLGFIAPLQETLWPDVPIVFGQVDEASYRSMRLPPNTTGDVLQFNISDMLAAARAAAPDTRNIAIVGDAFANQTAFRYFKDQIPEVAKQYNVIDLTGLPMVELMQRVASLPEATVIIYTAIYSDGRGTYFSPAYAIKTIAEKANRPTIIAVETYIGSGAVGGYVMVAGPIGEESARLTLRILGGEDAGAIPVTNADAVRPIFDWRAMQRWGVNASALPPGSEIRFRPETNYSRIVSQVTAVIGACVLACVIAYSIYEHRKRRHAEDAARQRMSELALVNRQATAGEMSAAIAHELNQPLGSILNNAEAAELILSSGTPDMQQLKELLDAIRRSDQRASGIIRQLRALVSKSKVHFSRIDLKMVANEALEIARIQTDARDVTLHRALTSGELPVLGDSIQLQQVILNLILNAIDAVRECPVASRDIVISASLSEGRFAEVSVSDTGPGLSPESIERVFQPFFSTKENGMGVGLSLCRTIIEAHEGVIWAANGMTGGAVFRFRLSLQKGRHLS
jgi:signal transduction histidine kinase